MLKTIENERKGLGQMKAFYIENFDHEMKIAVPAISNTNAT